MSISYEVIVVDRHKIIVNADDLFMGAVVDGKVITALNRGEVSSCSGFATVPRTAPSESLESDVKRSLTGVGVHLDLTLGSPLTRAFRKVPLGNHACAEDEGHSF